MKPVARMLRRPLVLGALLSLFVLLLAVLSAMILRQSTFEAGSERVKGLSATCAAYAGRSFAALDVLLRIVGNLDGAKKLDSQTLEKLRVMHEPVVQELAVLDPQGVIQVWTGEGEPPVVDDRDYFQAHMRSHLVGMYVGEPAFSRIDPEKMILGLSRAFRDDAGNLAAIAVVILDLDVLAREFEKLIWLSEDTVLLTRDDGTVLVRIPTVGEAVGSTIDELKEFVTLGAPENAVIALSPLDGSLRLIASRMVRAYPLIASSSLEVSRIVSEWLDSLRILIVLSLAVIVLVMGISYKWDVSFRAREIAIREAQTARAMAEQANRAKSHFLATMSHELRTPLNAVIGFSELLRFGVAGPLNPRQEEYAGDILNAGQHLLGLINDILDFEKIESGHYRPHVASLPIRPEIDEVLRFFEAECRNRNLELVNQASAVLHVSADRRALRQMLLNLLSNAVRHTPSGGRMVVGASAEKDGIVVRIADSGPGIPLTMLGKVLEPFNQADNAMTRDVGGSGLGLPIVKALITAHGGTIHISCPPGGGTVACLTFPYKEPRAEPGAGACAD